jgi:hypothetical protein
MLTRVTFGATPGGPQAVEGGRHQAGDVGAVPVVVGVGRVDAGRHLAGPVDQRDVGDEVAAQPAVEVGRDVRVAGVDAGVDDPHHHAAALVEPVGAARGGVDHPHVPLPVGEGLLAGGRGGRALAGELALALALDLVTRVSRSLGELADWLVAGGAGKGVLAAGLGDEGGVGRLDRGDTDLGVLLDDGAAGGRDGGMRGGRRGAVSVGDHVLPVRALQVTGRLCLGGRPRLTGWTRAGGQAERGQCGEQDSSAHGNLPWVAPGPPLRPAARPGIYGQTHGV